MTEETWLACEDASPMVDLVHGKLSERKIRLFGAACCRQVWHQLTDQRSKEMICVAERHADGCSGEKEFLSARKAADMVDMGKLDAAHYAAVAVSRLGWNADDRYDSGYHVKFLWYDVTYTLDEGEKPFALGALLRDIAGNPFRPVSLASSHRTPTVVSLAQAAYDERHLPSGDLDSHRLAVLADALEEAGACGELVAHLRGPGPHVRGCFAVDLCLGLT
jgi:hypothetical protein